MVLFKLYYVCVNLSQFNYFCYFNFITRNQLLSYKFKFTFIYDMGLNFIFLYFISHILVIYLAFFKLYFIILYYLTIFCLIFKKLHYAIYKSFKANVNIIHIEINKYRLDTFYYNK